MYGRILVPLDGSSLAEAALSHLNQVVGPATEVILLRVTEVGSGSVPVVASSPTTPLPPVAPAARPGGDKAFSDAEEYLEAKADLLRGHTRAVRCLVIGSADAASTIAEVAANEAVDLIIIASHGRSGVVRWVLGSVAAKLLRSTARPLLLVRPGQPTH